MLNKMKCIPKEGAIAFDACENKIDDEVKIEGSVDTTKVGTYEIKYSVTSGTKTSVKTRTVIVYDGIINNPISPNRDKVVYLTFDDGPGRYTEELLDILKNIMLKQHFL